MHESNPYAPPQAVVHDVATTYEQVELADLSTRFAAAITDGVILALAVYMPLVVAMAADTGSFGTASDTVALVALTITLATFGAWSWFTIQFVLRNGQSIGKKLLDIKVVRSDGSRASFARIFWLRNAVNALIGIIPFYVLVDHLFIFGGTRQCVHDKIADTIVVKA